MTEKTGTLLPFAADGYEPRVGDEAYFYLVQLTVLIGRVVNGHVFLMRRLNSVVSAWSEVIFLDKVCCVR